MDTTSRRGRALRDRALALLPQGPGTRVTFLRRLTAATLLVLAALLAVQPTGLTAADTVVVAAARDLAPGSSIGPEDVTEVRLPEEQVPAGALHDTSDVTDRVIAGAVRRGEPLTDVRLVGPALTRLATGDPDRVAVPVRLADPGVAGLLHPGRRVDIVTTDPASVTPSGATSVLAENVAVLAIGVDSESDEQGRLLVVGVPQALSASVAAASLTHSVTVTLR